MNAFQQILLTLRIDSMNVLELEVDIFLAPQ